MTHHTQNILIIGGGFSGMTAAIELKRLGFDVDLVEIDSGWRSYGAGISLGPATIRAFKAIGIAEKFLELGCGSDGISLRAPHGAEVAHIPTPRLAGAELPGGGAIMRPVLAKILADATLAAKVNVRLGSTFTHLAQDAEGVEVTFTDGIKKRYDAVIGADGLYSKVRESIFPLCAKPQYTGQCVWRMVLPRPVGVDGPIMWIGLPKVKVGVNPVSQTEMYLFVTEDRPTNDRLDPATFPAILTELLLRYPAPMVQSMVAHIHATSEIVYRPLQGLLVPQPWYQDRVVLIGDAVHATTPHLASGACIGIEDAIVLAQEMSRSEVIGDAFAVFQSRRWERCRMVVENSLRLGELEMSGTDKEEQARIMRTSLMALTAPI